MVLLQLPSMQVYNQIQRQQYYRESAGNDFKRMVRDLMLSEECQTFTKIPLTRNISLRTYKRPCGTPIT